MGMLLAPCDAATTTKPTVNQPAEATVVIPVLDEERALPRLIASLEQQSLRPAEVIVVDGGSRDGTCGWVRDYMQRTDAPLRLRLLQLQGSRPGRGRNAGVRAAATDFVACSDSGTEVHPDWLAHLVHALVADGGADVAIGGFVARGDTPFERYAGAMLVRPARKVKLLYAGGVSIAFRRAAWERVGGYPEDVYPCEDAVFLRELDAAGLRMVRAVEATTYWRPRASLRGVARQYRGYAWGDANIGLGLRRHVLRMGFYALVCALPWFGWLGVIGAAVVLLGYLVPPTARAFAVCPAPGVLWFGPVILLTKDLSQILGYLEGQWNRLRRGPRDFALRRHRVQAST